MYQPPKDFSIEPQQSTTVTAELSKGTIALRSVMQNKFHITVIFSQMNARINFGINYNTDSFNYLFQTVWKIG